MSSLPDLIDRFTYTAESIRSAIRNASLLPTGPYTKAVLYTPLGDLARDADASEFGLFTLGANTTSSTTSGQTVPGTAACSTVPPSGAGAGVTAAQDDADIAPAMQKPAVTRVEFPGATPLRKIRASRVEKNIEPEVYAEAALKYIDRYNSIRPMPRARQEVESILERLSALRREIKQFENVPGKHSADTEATLTAKEEEKRIHELNLRIKHLKARKDVMYRKRKYQTAEDAVSPFLEKDKEEEDFWNSPAVPSRSSRRRSNVRQSLIFMNASPFATIRDVSADDTLLLNSKLDVTAIMGDVTLSSFSDDPSELPTPLPAMRTAAKKELSRSRALDFKSGTLAAKSSSVPRSGTVTLPASSPEPSSSFPPRVPPKSMMTAVLDEDDSLDESGESTIMLSKPPQIDSSPPSPSAYAVESTSTDVSPRASNVAALSTPPRASDSGFAFSTPAANSTIPQTPGTAMKSRIKVTQDFERIVAKIWSTVGDIIMPGHPFNTASVATTNKPPRAKETIVLLQNLASSKAPQTSPSVRSHTTLSLTSVSTDRSQPSAQQILTAHLLLALLHTPTNSMHLAQAKATLAAVGLSGPPAETTPGAVGFGVSLLTGGGQALETRALYGCIVKRLLKIDRGGREQILKFDV